jgi:hypothetical protein
VVWVGGVGWVGWVGWVGLGGLGGLGGVGWVGWVVGWGRCPIHRPEVNAERASCLILNHELRNAENIIYKTVKAQ